MLIKVEFRPGGQEYTYYTDQDVAVGDRVMVPTSAQGETEGKATVTQLSSDYEGTPKSVLYKLPPG